jgi:ABC-type glycerol-3-phosphate transport system substrate-binding protein
MSLKRIVCLALAAVLLAGAAASFSGCRKKQQAVKEIADHVYRSQTLKIGDGDAGNTNVEQFTRIGDGIYASVYSYDPETYESTRLLYRVDPDTGALSSVDVPKTELGENTNEQTLMPAGDGTFWQIYYTYSYDELTYEYSETYVLRRIDGNGKEFCSVDLSALWGENTDDEWHYVEQTFPLGDALLLSDSTSLYRFEKDGTVSAKLSLRDLSEEGGYIRSIFGDENDTQILYTDYSMSMSLGKGSSTFLIPITWGERPAFGERQELPEEIFQYANTITTGPGYSLYFTDENGVYGYDAAAQTKTLLLDFLNSDLSSSTANNLIVISPDRFVTYGYDDVLEKQTAMILTRVPEEEIVPKYILTLAVVGGLWSVRSPVLLFNRQSEEYRIKIKLYNPDDYYDPLSADDYDWNDLVQKAVDALNNDIIAGRVPDILYVDEYIPIDSYAAKGLLVDLNTYIEKDPRFSRSDFLGNVLSAFEIGGKLYRIMPSFCVTTFAGKKSVVGDRTHWTMDEFIAWANALPETTTVFENEMTRDTLLDLFCSFFYTQLVDPATGACRFDSEEFRQLLRYANTLAAETIYEQHQDDEDFWNEYWESYEYRFVNDTVALAQFTLNSFSSITGLMNYTMHTSDVTLIGLPTASASGATITSNTLSFAITTKSAVPDGAWEFVSSFLTEEYQDAITSGFPMRVSSLEKMAAREVEEQQQMKKEYEENGYYTYPGGVIKDYAASYDVTGGETPTLTVGAADEPASPETSAIDDGFGVDEPITVLPVDPGYEYGEMFFLDRGLADELLAFLHTLDHTASVNVSILNIIHEDAAAYFSGQKSLDETVKIIQNRATWVIGESR